MAEVFTMKHIIRTSLTRIADFDESARIKHIPRKEWAWGDYVACEVTASPGMERWIELPNGRLINVAVRDQLIGALGTRSATMAMTGSWKKIGQDGVMHVLTAAGLFGRVTSISPTEQTPIELTYSGHVIRGNNKVNMREYALQETGQRFLTPVILIVGSAMSSGKTNAGRVIIRRLKQMDASVLAAKLTGAGRYRDVLSMKDAGADSIFDFVDAGLPSTVCSEPYYRGLIGDLLSNMATINVDVAVIEAGASPLEPYNGAAAVDLVRNQTRLCVLCATDPYAVVGMIKTFNIQPDIVAGIACNTQAGIDLIEKMTHLRAMNLTDPVSYPLLDEMLVEKLGLGPAT
jgi:hypothetical protein